MDSNQPGEYERLLEPLLAPSLILAGIRHGILPAMPQGGYSLAQYVEIVTAMGRAATEGGDAPERWLWAAINKAKKCA